MNQTTDFNAMDHIFISDPGTAGGRWRHFSTRITVGEIKRVGIRRSLEYWPWLGAGVVRASYKFKRYRFACGRESGVTVLPPDTGIE